VKPNLNSLGRLVRDLDAAGFAVALDGASIAIFPAERLTPDFRQRISATRADLVELLEVHGPALLPLFRDPESPLTEWERAVIARNAEDLRRRFHRVTSLAVATPAFQADVLP
jgi:hypothetical protein